MIGSLFTYFFHSSTSALRIKRIHAIQTISVESVGYETHSHITHSTSILEFIHISSTKHKIRSILACYKHPNPNPSSPFCINQVPALSISRVLAASAAYFPSHTPSLSKLHLGWKNEARCFWVRKIDQDLPRKKRRKKNSEAFRTKKLKAKRETEINCVKFSQAMYKTNVYEKKLPIKEMFGYT